MALERSNSLHGEIMLEYAALTGFEPAAESPCRYLWTDSFAVCNFLGLFRETGEKTWLDLALRLVHQVHHTLGRHRGDDPRLGWISGLDEWDGELHPTRGGLRIGKELNERGTDEPLDERLEWDRDGQYYHYLTKWMHALSRVALSTGDPRFLAWGIELAGTVHARFAHIQWTGGPKRLYWKMSIDLTRPLVSSMGQHDPLDGLLTCHELRQVAARDFSAVGLPDLHDEIKELAGICRGMSLTTDDPLGIGGLLCDACRMVQLIMDGSFAHASLLEKVMNAALLGMESFTAEEPLDLPVAYRLPFRELGLSIGLKGVERISRWNRECPDLFAATPSIRRKIERLMRYTHLASVIEQFWQKERTSKPDAWEEHRDINMVMLATSLAPDGFLVV
ncbi:MAG: hypothetical protein EG828_08835 [Deltaproteobacteria bacterium]|nr:hypothetical protein [Deltaproteobacteria bacterium]